MVYESLFRLMIYTETPLNCWQLRSSVDSYNTYLLSLGPACKPIRFFLVDYISEFSNPRSYPASTQCLPSEVIASLRLLIKNFPSMGKAARSFPQPAACEVPPPYYFGTGTTDSSSSTGRKAVPGSLLQ